MFNGIMKSLNCELGTDLSEAEIFLCFGGYKFSVIKTEEVFYEGASIMGNWADFDYFSNFTNLKFELKNYKESDYAFEYIFNKINSNNIQLAIVNCYYLPFDIDNYKKRFGKHLILVEKYSESEKCFYVTDERYNKEKIDFTDFTVALTNNFHTDMHLLNILNTENFEIKKIRENIPLILLDQARKNRENCFEEFRKLNEIIGNMNQLDPFQRSFSYFEMMRSIKSPNGPIISKHYLLNSSYIKDPDLSNLINGSLLKWERLCIDLYKAHLKDEVLDFNEKISVIEELENKINEKILNIM